MSGIYAFQKESIKTGVRERDNSFLINVLQQNSGRNERSGPVETTADKCKSAGRVRGRG